MYFFFLSFRCVSYVDYDYYDDDSGYVELGLGLGDTRIGVCRYKHEHQYRSRDRKYRDHGDGGHRRGFELCGGRAERRGFGVSVKERVG